MMPVNTPAAKVAVTMSIAALACAVILLALTICIWVVHNERDGRGDDEDRSQAEVFP